MGNNQTADIEVKGMILSAQPVGDADKRLVLLTQERGRLVVFARGARRQNSLLLAVSNPFTCGQFRLTRGRNTYYLHSAQCDQYFRELTLDYQKSCYGFYFLEFAQNFALENNDETNLLNLLVQSIRALLNPSIPDALIRYIYELKVLVLNGEAPSVFSCGHCGKNLENGYFSIERRGILCEDCRENESVALDASTLYTLQYIVSAPLKKLYHFVVSDVVFAQIQKVMELYRKRYVDIPFRSLAFLPEK